MYKSYHFYKRAQIKEVLQDRAPEKLAAMDHATDQVVA